jgi:hypothetical protein
MMSPSSATLPSSPEKLHGRTTQAGTQASHRYRRSYISQRVIWRKTGTAAARPVRSRAAANAIDKAQFLVDAIERKLQ